MVISNISLTKDAHFITLTADITYRGKETQQVYFKTAKSYESFITTDASPFLAAVLLSCMKTRENIYIDGSVSKKLLQNAATIMSFLRKQNIGLYKIRIRSKRSLADSGRPRYVGTFFTADVNSFYTYLTHRTKKDRITHLIVPYGFASSQGNKSLVADVKKVVDKVAKDERIKIIVVETNVSSAIKYEATLNFAHGGGYAAIALFLRKKVKQVLLPNTGEDMKSPKNIKQSELDNLWATESLRIRCDGEKFDSFHKITKVISKSPLALKSLRVCTHNNTGKYNCSRCFVCLNTMITLVCADSLKRAKTFDKVLDLNLVKKMYYDYRSSQNIVGEKTLSALKRQHREQALQEAITYSLEISRRPRFMKHMYQFINFRIYVEKDSLLSRIALRISKTEEKNAMIKFLSKRHFLK